MYFESLIASDVAKLRTERAERKAAENWRFRHLKPKSSKVVTAVLTSVLSFLVG